jgi:hypothetical protein
VVRAWRCQTVSARAVALASCQGSAWHPGARDGLPYRCLADRLLRQVHGHRAIEDVKGQVRLAAHHRADRPLQHGDLFGAVHATNFEGHALHRVFSFAVRGELPHSHGPARVMDTIGTGTAGGMRLEYRRARAKHGAEQHTVLDDHLRTAQPLPEYYLCVLPSLW